MVTAIVLLSLLVLIMLPFTTAMLMLSYMCLKDREFNYTLMSLVKHQIRVIHYERERNKA